ncbi:MAG: radical SAM protein [Candidatus Omnitrophota bacterium]|nr:radical SAM protein [Candidatus Omnitrophota bacterium]
MKNKRKSIIPTGAFNLIKAKILKIKFPHAIQFNITFRCNQRCSYCGIYNDKRYEMDTEEICKMLDEFAAMGTSRLSITGGEPLIREDFPIIVKHAKECGFSVALATNGSLISERLNYLEGVDNINMTLDGPQEIHDKQRGQGNFRKVIEAINLIKSKEIPLYLVSVITKNNYSLIDELLRLAKNLNVRLLLQPVFYAEQSHANNLKGYADTKYEDNRMIETLDRLINSKKRGNDNIILSERYYQNVKKAIMQNKRIRCRNAGSLFSTISPDGKVAPCNLLVRDDRWLDGKKIGFKEAFLNMPKNECQGCLSSFLDIDDLYSLKPDVVWNYYKHYFTFFVKT